jgi:superfamily II DNA or RNA helicase
MLEAKLANVDSEVRQAIQDNETWMNVSDRYDAFQREAVQNVLADFREDPKGRFLLVIPTGGGKTTTAVKAVHALYASGQLKADGDRAMWVVHREELKVQAQDTFQRIAAEINAPALPGYVDILMLSEIKQYLADHPDARLAVVDEAHHVAAKSYQPLFERPSLGILGLTATPSRHDGQPLQFTRESFSVGFPELISMGVLLRPTVIQVPGGTYDDIVDIGDDSKALEILNNDERNQRLVSVLSEHRARLNKIIIYVGTKQHARDLYTLLRSSTLKDGYESVSLILGDERRRWICDRNEEIAGETRSQFVQAQKSARRSILVNVDVLTEGYDDPAVNTIVMARPTSSKLVYMQALGRAVRIDPQNPEKDAYVVEVTDNLPNIKYRIDNRWLYSDVSDLLEPDVVDVPFASSGERDVRLAEIFDRFRVAHPNRVVPPHTSRDRVTVLLFKVYAGAGNYEHIPLIITNDTRQAASNFFNYLATRMKRLHGLDIEQVFRPVLKEATQFAALHDSSNRKYVFQAMENAWDLVKRDVPPPSEAEAGRPWITFVSFRPELSEESLGDDLLQFTEGMLNSDVVRASLRSESFGDDFYLLKFPLPLRGAWGVFLPGLEFSQLKKTIEELTLHATEADGFAQWKAATAAVNTAAIAIEPRYIQSLTTIVRETLDYFRPVVGRSARSLR